MPNMIPPDETTRAAASALETNAVAAHCAASIDKLLALTNGGPSGELSAKAAAALAADIAHMLKSELGHLTGR
jgi:hypothetical protein